jgi:hypothetical protein
VTKRACRWCGRAFLAPPGPGRPRLYCRQSCRQRDYESRQRASELGLGEDELIITRTELDLIKDRLYVLSCTVEDAEKDLTEPHAEQAEELHRILDYVLKAARETAQSS